MPGLLLEGLCTHTVISIIIEDFGVLSLLLHKNNKHFKLLEYVFLYFHCQ